MLNLVDFYREGDSFLYTFIDTDSHHCVSGSFTLPETCEILDQEKCNLLCDILYETGGLVYMDFTDELCQLLADVFGVQITFYMWCMAVGWRLFEIRFDRSYPFYIYNTMIYEDWRR